MNTLKATIIAIALTLAGSVEAQSALKTTGGSGSSATQCASTVNINTASAADLLCLDGVGPVLAERIVAARAELGGRFERVEDLMRVRGIGRGLFARIAGHITI